MPNSNIDIISRKVVLFQSELLELKKKISELLTEKTLLERELSSLRENLAEVRQENSDLQEIVYDLNKENNHLKSKLEQMVIAATLVAPVAEPALGISAGDDILPVQEPQLPDPLEQKRREAELEKQLFEYERNSTISDSYRSESDENNFDSGEQD
jgi:FtsZ-binding cell division protein ZapB